jgi:catechol 2,3-dioxygenase-like lactoylglutathione lyase family enzyme
MLDARVEAVIPVSDRERAIDFYGNLLGLELVKDEPDEIVFKAGYGTMVSLYESVGAGQSRATLAAFMVDDLDDAVDGLAKRGLEFEEYDFAELRTVNRIADLGTHRAAWFKDPDGNILAVASREEPAP